MNHVTFIINPMEVATLASRQDTIDYLASQYRNCAKDNGETPREFCEYAVEPDMRLDVMREIRRTERAAQQGVY